MVALRIALCKAKRGEGDLYTAQADWDFALQRLTLLTRIIEGIEQEIEDFGIQ